MDLEHVPTSASVVLRRRRPEDIPTLVEVLLAQQPTSRYPFRDPLPFPPEQFLHAGDAVAAWVAEVDGEVAGHVCRVAPPAGFPEAGAMNQRCAEVHGCRIDELAWVSTLFVGLTGRRRGVGGRLLEAVVDDIRGAGLHPCLEVLPIHPAAVSMYESAGWRDVMQVSPAWLRDAGEHDIRVRVMVLPESP